MNSSIGTFISMDTYEGSIYDPDTLHKYLYANGNPVTYSDPSGNMFSIAEGAISAGIQSVFNNMVQIMYNGVISGLVNMIFTCVMGGSFKETMSSFVTGFIIGAGITAIRYFVVGAKLVTLARFYVLSASASFIFNTTITIFAITQGLPELAVMSGVFAILSLAEWGFAYGNYLLVDVYGDKGCATIECNPSGNSEGDMTYSPANPGPLKPQDANSFSGGTYTEKTLTSDTTFYRVYGGGAGKVGQYMTRTPQNGGLQSQIDLALNPDWGNTAQYVIKVTVPKGTIIYEGTAAPQIINGGAGQLIGGGNQVFIPWEELDSLWFGN